MGKKNIYFSTYLPPRLIHLSHRFISASKPATYKSFDLSQSLPHRSDIICGFRTSLREFLDTVVKRFTRQTLPIVKRKHFFMNILCIESFFPQKKKRTTGRCTSVLNQARSPFWLLKSASQLVYVRLLPRLSWSWTVLLPSDTHRQTITSITAVVLPFMTYLLTPS
jgi:hypothetical protein